MWHVSAVRATHSTRSRQAEPRGAGWEQRASPRAVAAASMPCRLRLAPRPALPAGDFGGLGEGQDDSDDSDDDLPELEPANP